MNVHFNSFNSVLERCQQYNGIIIGSYNLWNINEHWLQRLEAIGKLIIYFIIIIIIIIYEY